MVSQGDPRPVFQQVADVLRSRIVDGTYGTGTQIPSVREIEADFGIATNTAQRALRVLRSEGLIETRPGSGNYVTERRRLIHRSASYVTRQGDAPRAIWGPETAKQGMVAGQTIVFAGQVPAPLDVAVRLNVEEGATVVCRRRHLTLDGQPTEVAESYFPADIAADTELVEPRKVKGGMLAALERVGVTLAEALDEVSVRPASPDEALALDVPSDVVWVIEIMRTTFDVTGRPVEVDRMAMRADRHTLQYRIPTGT